MPFQENFSFVPSLLFVCVCSHLTILNQLPKQFKYRTVRVVHMLQCQMRDYENKTNKRNVEVHRLKQQGNDYLTAQKQGQQLAAQIQVCFTKQYNIYVCDAVITVKASDYVWLSSYSHCIRQIGGTTSSAVRSLFQISLCNIRQTLANHLPRSVSFPQHRGDFSSADAQKFCDCGACATHYPTLAYRSLTAVHCHMPQHMRSALTMRVYSNFN